jgi:hypothetical protein
VGGIRNEWVQIWFMEGRNGFRGNNEMGFNVEKGDRMDFLGTGWGSVMMKLCVL